MKTKSRISRITVGRLFNLGNYEHVRYDITVEIPDGASSTKAMIGLERIMEGLAPLKMLKTADDFKREAERIKRIKEMSTEAWNLEYQYAKGSRQEIIKRYEADLRKEIAKAKRATDKAEKARKLLDDLGGAMMFKDAKLSWDNDHDDYEY